VNEKIKQVWAAAACVESLQAEMDQAQAALSHAIADALAAGAPPEGVGAAANLTLPELERRVRLLQTFFVPGIPV
jgi:multidrug resistance efflux pump